MGDEWKEEQHYAWMDYRMVTKWKRVRQGQQLERTTAYVDIKQLSLSNNGWAGTHTICDFN